jgi:methionine-rich copper-binding protein CopC
MSALRRFVLVALFALFAVPALAHAILLESSPAVGATVPAGEVAISLRFNSRIDVARSRLTLIRPDKSHAVLPLAGDGPGIVLHSAAVLAPGAVVLRWQVLAVDGHITRGDVALIVVGP